MSGDRKKPIDPLDKASSEPEEQVSSTDLVVTGDDNALTVVDEQVTELQEQLAEAKDEKNELLFYFILTAVIVFDVFAFRYMASNLSTLLVFFLQCLLLLPVARKLGIEEPAVLLATIMRAIISRVKKQD